MTNTTEQKTGIIEARRAVSKQAEIQSEMRGYAEEYITRELMDRIANILSDGRAYVVQVLPALTRSDDIYFTHIVRQAFVWLANAKDTEIGEFCDPDSFGATKDMERQLIVQDDRAYAHRYTFQRINFRFNFRFGEYMSVWAWLRVE